MPNGASPLPYSMLEEKSCRDGRVRSFPQRPPGRPQSTECYRCIKLHTRVKIAWLNLIRSGRVNAHGWDQSNVGFFACGYLWWVALGASSPLFPLPLLPHLSLTPPSSFPSPIPPPHLPTILPQVVGVRTVLDLLTY